MLMPVPKIRANFLRSPGYLLWVALVSCHLVSTAKLRGEDAAAIYLQHVQPVLQKRCYSCHGALKQESQLRLDTVAAMRHGGDSGPVVVDHRPDASLLLARIRDTDPDSRMPPEGELLKPDEIAKIEQWISFGAAAPATDHPQPSPSEHWAFQPLERPPLPTDLTDPVNSNPIDRWLKIEQDKLGVKPLEMADQHVLIRRLFLDLLGLPPTPAEIETFIKDGQPDAYQRLVDQLLDRPEYGERWGRHWMDVWRYSDWYGRRSVPDVMISYPQIWRWRDWIVRSLNQDKGYDRMVTEMLAADEICPDDDQNIVATGFLVRNWYKWNYETWMKDNVEHTGRAFLGLSIHCAHCHDHKYDPITQRDYFHFRAFFEPLELRHDRVQGQADPGPFRKYVYAQSYGPIATGAIRVFDEKLDAQTYIYSGGDNRNRIEGVPPVEPRPPKSLSADEFPIHPVALPPEAAYPGLKEFVRREEIEKATAELQQSNAQAQQSHAGLSQAVAQLEDLRSRAAQPLSAGSLPSAAELLAADHAATLAHCDAKIAQLTANLSQAKLQSLRSRIAADDAQYRGLGDSQALIKLASRSERDMAYISAQHAAQIAERKLIEAEYKLAAATDKIDQIKQEATKAAESLQAANKQVEHSRSQLNADQLTYTPLSPLYPQSSTGRRSALAAWIVSQQNPLTARVAVNHIWLRHFGQALVESVDNFGIQGKLPAHPQLLDWLAVEFMENGWSMKHLHRLIVTSQAYRRSSAAALDHPNRTLDSTNGTLWRSNARRMEAEVVRDSVLACSGALDKSMGGQEIDPANWFTVTRRSLYFTIHGEAKMQFLDIFDGPNVCDCYRRTSTVLPQQALALTNSELLIHHGRLMARRISDELGSANQEDFAKSDLQFVQHVFQYVLNRPASEGEERISMEFLSQQQQMMANRVSDENTPKEKTAENKMAEIKVTPAARDIRQRARENLAISLFSHNEFVTIR